MTSPWRRFDYFGGLFITLSIMFLLWEGWQSPSLGQELSVNIDPSASPGFREGRRWYELRNRSGRVAVLEYSTLRQGGDWHSDLALSWTSELKLLAGSSLSLHMESDEDHELQELELMAKLANVQLAIRGQVEGEQLQLQGEIPQEFKRMMSSLGGPMMALKDAKEGAKEGAKGMDLASSWLSGLDIDAQGQWRMVVPVSGPSFISIYASILAEKPREGQIFNMESFDPLGMEQSPSQIRYQGKERLLLMGDEVELHHFQHRQGEIDLELWINDRGEIVALDSPYGVQIRRISEADATWSLHGKS